MVQQSTDNGFPTPDIVVDGGDLGVGNGLLMLLREAMEPLAADSVVAVTSTDATVAHDLPGNVAEFCQDWWGSLGSGNLEDPAGPPVGDRRVLRSYAFFDTAKSLGASHRAATMPSYPIFHFGIRIVCEIPFGMRAAPSKVKGRKGNSRSGLFRCSLFLRPRPQRRQKFHQVP